MVCLEASRGSVLWIKKYEPKSYSLFNFWSKNTFAQRNSIAYDSQFMNLDEQDNWLYYKPRESDYLYILDPETGESKLEMLVDTGNFYLLWSAAKKAIFLERADKNNDAKIKVIELEQGRQLNSFTVKGGQLKGVLGFSPNEIVFKIDNRVYFLAVDKGSLTQAGLEASMSSWLAAYKHEILFTAEDGGLTCFDIPDKAFGHPVVYQQAATKRSLKNNPVALSLDLKDEQAFFRACQILLNDSSILEVSFDKLFAAIMTNLETLKLPQWKEIISKLAQSYKQKIIKYQGIGMRFVNFLFKSGLIDADNLSLEQKRLSQKVNVKENFLLRADKIFPLFLNVVQGMNPPDLILILRDDQLIAVNEAGEVLWARKVFYLPYPLVNYAVNYATDKCTGRMYADEIQAYYYDGVIIINDQVNVFAVKASDGSYLWSLTNEGEAFEEQRQLPVRNFDKLYERYGVNRPFLKQIKFHTNFLNDRLIITHGNTIYSVDPLTGYCLKQKKSGIEGAIRVLSAGQHLYLFSYFLDNFKVFDAELSLVGDYPLPFINDQQAYPEILFLDKHIILQAGAAVYLIDKLTGKLADSIALDAAKEYYLEIFRDNLLIIRPFEKITSYALKGGFLKVEWEHTFYSEDSILWKYMERKTRRYFIIDQAILMPARRSGKYFICAVGLEKGNKIWESLIPDATGALYDLSDCVKFNGKAVFILTTEWHGGIQDGQMDSDLVDLISVRGLLVWLNLADGKLTKLERLPAINQERMIQRGCVVETQNRLVYGINRKIVRVENKGYALDN